MAFSPAARATQRSFFFICCGRVAAVNISTEAIKVFYSGLAIHELKT